MALGDLLAEGHVQRGNESSAAHLSLSMDNRTNP
jgi:hypothetical protein